MYYVYILECCDGSFYTGFTVNLRRRVAEHKIGQSVCTKNIRPVRLVFYGCFENKSIAARFEQYLKSHSGIAFRNKRLISLPGVAARRRQAEVAQW